MITVALSFHSGDAEQARRLLRWIGKISNVKAYDILLVVDAGCPFDKAMEIEEIAAALFKTATIITTDRPYSGWPHACNQHWFTAMKWGTEKNVSVLFLEPDCVVLKSTWLEELNTAYEQCGKQHMGAIENVTQPLLPPQVLSGVAIYGPKAGTWPQVCVRAWNTDFAHLLIPDSADTNLIRDFFGQPNLPPVFVSTLTPASPAHHFTLDWLPKEAVLFHRDKTHSLMPLLAKRLGIEWETPLPTPVIVPPANTRADYVSLRRAGDIINLLPALLHRSFQWNRKARLVVHRDFIPIVEGLSYAEPCQWDGDWENPLAAAKQFKAKNAQVFGKGLQPNVYVDNYAKLAWRQIGMEFNRYTPLVLDNRNAVRELALAQSVFQTEKPKILVKLHGFSSPMAESGWIREKMRNFSEQAEIVWLDSVKAEWLVDLVGLMDCAAVILTIDTSILHLCQATKTPCIQLVNGPGFPASPPRGNVICRMNYREVHARWHDIEKAVNKCLTISKHGSLKVIVAQNYKSPDADALRRETEALKSWDSVKARRLFFRPKRHSGDGRNMPFVRDMIDAAGDGPEDIIIITNNDIIFDPGLSDSIDSACRESGCWWAYRLDGPGGRTDEGADTFAFTKSWWHLHEHLFPDFLLGYYNWDDVLVRMMMWSGCYEQERLIYHTPHPQTQSPTRLHTGGARHNQTLMQHWMARHDEKWEKPKP